jgi:HSP20 family protein
LTYRWQRVDLGENMRPLTQVMRYRRLTYRYTMVVGSGQDWPFGDIWQGDRPRLLVQGRWRPDADTYETSTTVEIRVDLAGIDEEDFEVQLFDDVLVVTGRRRLAVDEGAMYHEAGIRQGPFQVALPLPAPIVTDGVEARYERGLLRITLLKRRETS